MASSVSRFELDLKDSADREKIRRVARGFWRSHKGKAAIYYTGLLAGLLLWIVPVTSPKLKPSFKLIALLTAGLTVGAATSALDNLQDDIDDAVENRNVQRALKSHTSETLEASEHYALATQKRLAINAALPDHLKEPDLLDRTADQTTAEADDKEEFAAWVAEAKGLDPAAAASGDNAGAADALTADISKKKYRLGTRPNPRFPQQKETIVDLSDEDSYCGLPITDLADLIAQDDKGVFVVAPSGCGKTELERRCIRAQYEIDELTDFSVWAHKAANKARNQKHYFCGLEKTKSFYELNASMRKMKLVRAALAMKDGLNEVDSLLDTGSEISKVVVIDQSNQGIVAAKNAQAYALREKGAYPEIENLETDYKATLVSALVDGSELGVKAWVFAHANTCSALGIEHQLKTNVRYAGLARKGNYSGIEGVLNTDLYIGDKPTRDALKLQLATFRAAHNKLGSPANVVIGLTSAGGEDWRLMVLPQPQGKVKPITLNATNPHINDIDGDGLSDDVRDDIASDEPETSELEETMNETETNVPEDFRDKLEKTLAMSYTAEQKTAATDLVRWVKANARDYVDSKGLIDPQEIWHPFSGTASSEEMEALLDLITEIGGGDYETDSLTSERFYRLNGMSRLSERYGFSLNRTAFFNEGVVWDEESTAVGAVVVEQSNDADNPGGVSDEVMAAIISQLMKEQIGSWVAVSDFLRNSNQLKRVLGLKVPELKKVLAYLHYKECVIFPSEDESQFQVLGFNKYQ